MAVVRVRGRFASDGDRLAVLPISTRYSEDAYKALITLGDRRADFIRAAVAEKLARSGPLVEKVAIACEVLSKQEYCLRELGSVGNKLTTLPKASTRTLLRAQLAHPIFKGFIFGTL